MAMRSSRCTFSTTAALHRIFIAPIEHSSLRLRQYTVFTTFPKQTPPSRERRCYTSPTLLQNRLPSRLPRDDEIVEKTIYVVYEGNRLSTPQDTSSVLSSIDRKTQTLVMVVQSGPNLESPDRPGYPICKIQSKKLLHEIEKAKSKKKDTPSAILKTIELNWAIDPHDLNHRLERVKEFLSKGWRVDIFMAGKKKGRKAAPEEAAAVVAKVRDAIARVDGAREWKRMDGNIGFMATIFAEGNQAPR